MQTDLSIESTYFSLQLADGSKFKRSQSWRKILKKKDRKDKIDKVKEKEEGKLDGANSGSDSSISQTSTTSSASIGGKRANGKSTGMAHRNRLNEAHALTYTLLDCLLGFKMLIQTGRKYGRVFAHVVNR